MVIFDLGVCCLVCVWFGFACFVGLLVSCVAFLLVDVGFGLIVCCFCWLFAFTLCFVDLIVIWFADLFSCLLLGLLRFGFGYVADWGLCVIKCWWVDLMVFNSKVSSIIWIFSVYY